MCRGKLVAVGFSCWDVDRNGWWHVAAVRGG